MMGITTPSVVLSAMRDIKSVGTQFSSRMAPTPPCTGTYARGHPKLGGGTLPNNVWQGQHGPGLPPTMNLPGSQGQQGQPPAPGPPGGGQNVPVTAAVPQAPLTQQSGAQIAVQPPGGHGGAGAGLAQATAGMGALGPPSQEYLGIAMALDWPQL